ncbi:MAG: hypothetical protein E7434_02005 [Ruminococcaceae bacterium]|nr:hypothetical protein [Oscillospiraceae bacterium]
MYKARLATQLRKLFWLQIASAFSVPLIGIFIGVLFLRLDDVNENYKKAGIFCLLRSVCNIFGIVRIKFFFLATGVSLVGLVFAVLSIYYECKAHSQVLECIDGRFSDRWLMLFKWNTAVLCSVPVIMLCSWLLPSLVLFLTPIVVIFGIVVTVFYLIYLYRTAEIFLNTKKEAVT